MKFLLTLTAVLSVAALATAACGPARATPVRSAIGAVRAHHLERVESRVSARTARGGCAGATSYGCTGYTPAQAPMPLPMPPVVIPVDPKKGK